MKNKNKVLMFLLVTILPFFSCTEMLDKEPDSSITNASFWKTQDDAVGALMGMYCRFRDEVAATSLFLLGEARSSDMVQSVGNVAAYIPIFNNTITEEVPGTDWIPIYKPINDANLIITHVLEMEDIDEKVRDQILAEAYTMRAYLYYILVRSWGETIINTEPTESYDLNKLLKERSSVTETFTLIKKDIDQALSLYPDNNFYTNRHRWSKAGANALKADVYLWTGKLQGGGNNDFNIALQACKDAESADLQLLPDFNRVFDYDNKGNKEIIFAANFQLDQSGINFMRYFHIDKIPANADPVGVADIGIPGQSAGNYFTLSNESLSKFSNDDLRRKATFIDLYLKNSATGEYTDLYGCIIKKYEGLVSNGVRQFLDDMVIYRYADVLLMEAEALNALGQDPSVPINMVRQRAYGNHYNDHVFVSGTQTENDDKILDERLLEFFYEGKRWWDILRFEKAKELIPYFRDNPNDDYKLIWPIGLDVLSSDSKVEQNSGY